MTAPTATATLTHRDKPPPFNREAERSVLGSILIDDSHIWRVCGWLRPEHFYDPDHRMVYAAMCRLADDHSPIDIITVRDMILNDHPDQHRNGISATVSSLVDGVPDSAAIERWGSIVKRDYDRRHGMAMCEQSLEAFSASSDVTSIAAKLLDGAADMLDGHGREKATERASSLVASSLGALEARLAGDAVPPGIPTGYLSLDSKTHGFPRGAVTIIGAPPKTGKTTFVLNCALNAAEAGYHVLAYSIDMPKKFVADRLTSIASGVDTEFVKTGMVSQTGLWGGMSRDELLQAVMDGHRRISSMSGTLDVNDSADDLAEITAEITVRAKMKKVDIVFVDYVQQVQTSAVKTDSEHRRITHVAGRFRALARKLDVAIVLAAQPNRTLLKGERMQLRHLAESSSLEQVPRLALMLHRPGANVGADELPCDLQVIIEKNEGFLGTVQLHGEMWCYRITERTHGDDCAFERTRGGSNS